MLSRERQLEWLAKEIGFLQATQFYGKLVVSMQGGNIVHLIIEKSIKPPEDENGQEQAEIERWRLSPQENGEED